MNPRWYYFMSGLLYPGALGAVLTWWIEGLRDIVAAEADKPPPSLWAVMFGLWFIVYHCCLFVRMLDRHAKWASEGALASPASIQPYTLGALISDTVETLGLFLAFAALYFVSGASTGTAPGLVFVASAVVPFSPMLAPSPKRSAVHVALIIGAGGVSAAGAILNLCRYSPDSGQPTLEGLNIFLLVLLWLLLFIYLSFVYPEEFRDGQGGSPGAKLCALKARLCSRQAKPGSQAEMPKTGETP